MLLKYLSCFFISMVPLVELRLAVPMAVSMGLDYWPSLVVCVIGNLLPVPFIYFFARKILEWGKDKKYIGGFFSWCLRKGESGGHKLTQRAGRTGSFLALMLFVGIPLPGTGAWTGTLAASIFDMKFRDTLIACMGGVLLAGVIMGSVSAGLFGALGAVMG